MDVFISYSHEDGDFVAELCTKLQNTAGNVVWRDKDNLINGTAWGDAIDEALKNAALVVLVASPYAMNSAYKPLAE